ncbi:MAG: 2-hydroxyacid dehydrogenase [Colwellia sp.]
MRIAVFSSKPYDEIYLSEFVGEDQEIVFFETKLDKKTVVMAEGFDVLCCFVNDDLSKPIINKLSEYGIKLIALRCAGFNNVDLPVAQEKNITVCRVPEYSPHAVAEHALALLLSLNRNIHRAFNRVRENDYSLNGLLGFDLYQKKVGVIGTGKIGATFASIMKGMGCEVMAYDPFVNPDVENMGIPYVSLEEIWAESDIISLHCPLLPTTRHIVNSNSIAQMKKGVALINTSRGSLVDTKEVIKALKSGQVGYLGLDVYEEEANLFFENQSNQLLQDDVFARLQTFPNVIITGHQAFFTKEALSAIGRMTFDNINNFVNNNFDDMNLVKL